MKDHYVIQSLLGKGSYATVHKVYVRDSEADPAGRQYFAMKRTRKMDIVDGDGAVFRHGFVESARRESKIMMEMDHPHVVKCIKTWESDNHIYVVMEMAVCDLSTIIRLFDGSSGGRIMPESLWRMVMDHCLSGLNYMQTKHRLVHMDIKPGNILLMSNGSFVLSDFGLSRKIERGKETVSSVVGVATLLYKPPENLMMLKRQYSDTDASFKTDVWSLMIMGIEMMFPGMFVGICQGETFKMIDIVRNVFAETDGFNESTKRDMTLKHIKMLEENMRLLEGDYGPHGRNKWPFPFISCSESKDFLDFMSSMAFIDPMGRHLPSQLLCSRYIKLWTGGPLVDISYIEHIMAQENN